MLSEYRGIIINHFELLVLINESIQIKKPRQETRLSSQMYMCRGERIRTFDPLLPKQVR